MMKRIIYTTLCSLAVLAMACTHDDESLNRLEFSVSKSEVYVTRTAGIETLDIKANAEWTLEVVDSPWLTVSPTSGTGNAVVTLFFGENDTTEPREAEIIVNIKSRNRYVEVTQPGYLPGNAGIIIGDHVNECPVREVTLTVDPIEYATAYRWYRNGRVVSGSEPTLSVTQAGVYTVVGVNGSGAGEMSPPHEVAINDCGGEQPLIDQLVGTWSVEEDLVWAYDDEVEENNHMISIEKINNNTIMIINFVDEDDDTETIATVNETNETILISAQEVIPTWSGSYRTFLTPHLGLPYFCDNMGKDFKPQKVLKIGDNYAKIVFDNGASTSHGKGIYCVLAVAKDSDDCQGAWAYGVNTVWTKQSSRAPAAKSQKVKLSRYIKAPPSYTSVQ